MIKKFEEYIKESLLNNKDVYCQHCGAKNSFYTISELKEIICDRYGCMVNFLNEFGYKDENEYFEKKGKVINGFLVDGECKKCHWKSDYSLDKYDENTYNLIKIFYTKYKEYEEGKYKLFIDILKEDGKYTLWLNDLVNYNMDAGFGTLIMNYIIDFCDKYNLISKLQASNSYRSNTSLDRLVNFYERFGYKKQGDIISSKDFFSDKILSNVLMIRQNKK